MKFTGRSKPLSKGGLDAATELLGVGEAEVWTLLSVETKGCGYLPDRRPLILFERHVFYQQTAGAHGSPTPGGYVGGAGEYERLEEAVALDSHAALNSASWGIGQVMGTNAGLAGFESVELMVAAMIDDEDAQLTAVAQYLLNRKLHRPLADHRWDDFARGYNGPNYKENNYDIRLAAAYAGFSSGSLPKIEVRQAQVLLSFLGYHVGAIDGIPGKLTAAAITQFTGACGTIDASLLARLWTRCV